MEALVRYARETSAYEVCAVISNRPDAAGLGFAAKNGIEVRCVDHTRYETRSAFDKTLKVEIDAFTPDLIVLAGFMRILTAEFTEGYAGRLVNIHPSLLPSFPGLNTHQRALDAGVRLHGVTVHLVTPELDHGPILDQGAVCVEEGDTPESLANKLLKIEHRLYPRAVANYLSGRLVLEGSRILGAANVPLIFDMTE